MPVELLFWIVMSEGQVILHLQKQLMHLAFAGSMEILDRPINCILGRLGNSTITSNHTARIVMNITLMVNNSFSRQRFILLFYYSSLIPMKMLNLFKQEKLPEPINDRGSWTLMYSSMRLKLAATSVTESKVSRFNRCLNTTIENKLTNPQTLQNNLCLSHPP